MASSIPSGAGGFLKTKDVNRCHHLRGRSQVALKYFLTWPKRLVSCALLFTPLNRCRRGTITHENFRTDIKDDQSVARDMRTKVDRVVRTHVQACMKTGSPVENFDRVLIEAVEIVKLEERAPETRLEYSAEWEPHRHYDQYISPREM